MKTLALIVGAVVVGEVLAGVLTWTALYCGFGGQDTHAHF